MSETASAPINNTAAPLKSTGEPGAPSQGQSKTFAFPLPQSLVYPSSAAPKLITQGAEGRLYKTTYLTPSTPCALKHRPSKAYRHPTLDARLTRHRILSEARILQKCRKEGVCVPALYAVDERSGTLAMEWIPGVPVRVSINAFLKRRKDAGLRAGDVAVGEGGEEGLVGLLERVGVAVGLLHKAGVVHGDLTTSNMMARPWEPDGDGQDEGGAGSNDGLLDGEIVIIDFGLASVGTADEDRAVDLYVLERAFASTHPKAEGLFNVVLEAYRGVFKAAPVVLKKLEDVRMRGRKRSMLG